MLQKPQDPAAIASLEKLMHALWQDALLGDLEQSRARLTLHKPQTARRAVMHLGIPYLEKIKQLGDRAHLDGLSGEPAINKFVDDTLKPIVAAKPAPPPVKTEPPSAAVKKKKTSALRRSVATLSLIAGLGLGITTGAWLYQHAQQQESIPTPPVTNVIELRQEFTRTALGRELMALADKNGITIEYDATLKDRGRLAEYSADEKKATVRPDLSADDQILYLAHELRHAWQDIVVGYDEMEDRLLTPTQQWVLRRFIEADAAAFSAVFLAERMQDMRQTKQPLDSVAHIEYMLARVLLKEYTSPDGLTHNEYRQFVLTSAFDSLSTYNPQHILLATIGMQGISETLRQAKNFSDTGQFGKADIMLDHLDSLFASTPTAAEFDTWLRQMGGTHLDTEKPTALQDPAVTTQQMFNRYAGLTQSLPQPLPPGTPADDSAEHVKKLQIADGAFEGFRTITKQLRELNTLRQQVASASPPPSRIPKAQL